MTESATKLQQAIEQAASQYYRLVVLAGAPASGKTAALQSVAKKLDCPLLNVNLELSKRMLELTRTQRSRQIERLLKEVIAGKTYYAVATQYGLTRTAVEQRVKSVVLKVSREVGIDGLNAGVCTIALFTFTAMNRTSGFSKTGPAAVQEAPDLVREQHGAEADERRRDAPQAIVIAVAEVERHR